MKLIADSGSTKTDWCLTDNGVEKKRYATQGINPFQQNEDTIRGIIGNELLPRMGGTDKVTEVYFYGAGCRDEVCRRIEVILRQSFPVAVTVDVHSDLLAAARSLFGSRAGIACILGTGANSCLYDGKSITANVPPLGYILGDEGSGAVLGRNLLNALFKGRLSGALADLFYAETGFTVANIINKVYREPMANRFLAGFSLFIGRHISECPELQALVIDNFRAFFRNNVSRYTDSFSQTDAVLTVSAVGSMAACYRSEFNAAAALEGFRTETVERSPMDGLVAFHK